MPNRMNVILEVFLCLLMAAVTNLKYIIMSMQHMAPVKNISPFLLSHVICVDGSEKITKIFAAEGHLDFQCKVL